MPDDFTTVNKELGILKKDVEGLDAVKNDYEAAVKKRRDDLEQEVKNLTAKELSSETEWGKADQSAVIKKVREELPARLKMIKDSLTQAAAGLAVATKEAWCVIGTGIVLLLLLVGAYIALHYYPRIPSYDKEAAKDFFLKVGNVKALLAKSPVNLPEVKNALMDLPDQKNDLLTSEFKERISFLKGFASTFGAKETAVQSTDQRVVSVKDEVDKIEKEARALSKNDGFFWVASCWRWLEIMFWGEFGVIIGVLVWVCTQAENGKYTKEMFEREKYWYLSEVVFGPIVVIAVFFLLKQFVGTMITGITLTEEEVRASIYLTLGVSFALGLFIRRTLGVFNFIKDKLPLPKS